MQEKVVALQNRRVDGRTPQKQPDKNYGLPEILSVEQAAAFLGLGPKTVYQSVKDGEFPGKKIGRRVVILRDALLSWLGSTECVLPSRRKRSF